MCSIKYYDAFYFQKIPMKDFGSEVRGQLDAAHFFNNAVIILDLDAILVESIVDVMLGQLLLVAQEPNCSLEDAKACIFPNDSNSKSIEII